MTNLGLWNVHTGSGSEGYYPNVYVESQGSAPNAMSFTYMAMRGGRPCINVSASSQVDIEHNSFTGCKDGAVAILAGSQHVAFSNNAVNGSVTTGISGPPHDVNLEDSDFVTVDSNIIANGSGFTERGASCLQAYPNRHSTINSVEMKYNYCSHSPAGTIVGFSGGGPRGYNNFHLEHNTFVGYRAGVVLTGLAAGTMSEVYIDSNTITSSSDFGMDIGGNGSEVNCGKVHVGSNTISSTGQEGIYAHLLSGCLELSGNTVQNSGASGIAMYGVSNISVTSNVCFNNGTTTTGDGIFSEQWNSSFPSIQNTFLNNHVYDDQPKHTQRWGIGAFHNTTGTGVRPGGNLGTGNTAGLITGF
jgi:parallel beta-helix repeat protein